MEVKVSGGEFRGQKLKTPGDGTHPMGERERIALFNMLAGRLAGGRVADLYCGGGTLGIEALSRGAGFATFIDLSPRAVAVVKGNLQKLRINEAEVVLSDVAIWARTTTNRYDTVIADPPYDKYDVGMVEDLPRLLRDEGALVLSHPGEAPDLPGVVLEKSRTYAGATISVYHKSGGAGW